MMRGELHCHCYLSKPRWVHRALPTPFEVVDVAVKRGLDFLALTDHDTMDGYALIKDYAMERGLVIIPGIEITTKPSLVLRRRAHILAIGLHQAIDSFQEIEATIEQIHAQGGLAIAAHPFCSRFAKTLFLGHQVGDYQFDGIEVFNSSELDEDNLKSTTMAKLLNLKGYAGSDAHGLKNIGRATVAVKMNKTKDWQKIVETMSKGDFEIEKRDKSIQSFRQFWFGHFMRTYQPEI